MENSDQNVVFLFTDIERSSQLWEMHPQTMGRALAQHDGVLRACSDEHAGKVFKTIGDAFCVAFSRAEDAVLTAISAQRRLHEAAWEDTGPLRVRMAIHDGEVEARDGDYFGRTLNRVARVLASGHGGQTLVTAIIAESVRHELPDGVSLRDLGERRLKDLSHPERLFQIVIQGLPSEFPPLRSLEALPNNLPAQVTSFVGREREMAEVRRLLESTRLLTLTGSGGSGKTRLSLQVAAEVLDRFPYGVWLVELATVSDPDLIPAALASVIDVREEADRPLLETLAEALRARKILFVLDNCEHLICGCAQVVTTLLRKCPEVSFLASSREPLNISGETVWQIPAFASPDLIRHDFEESFDLIRQLDSVQLFVERATAVRPDFTLTPENAALVASICAHLDGIPLAIELAAARIKVLPLAQILVRLNDRFRLLTGGSRSALPRQQTLSALIDWSYDLLSEPERSLLRRLAVFVAGRTLEMAEEVCADGELSSGCVFDVLNALVEKSLVTVETDVDGNIRYTMLESVWHYANEKLAASGETEVFREKHLQYFVRFAEEGEPHLFSSEQKIWLDNFSIEHANFERALLTSRENSAAIALGLRLAGALTRYWEVRSYLNEGYETFVELLGKGADTMALAVRAKAELGAGRLSWCQDRDADALRHYGNARRLYEELQRPDQVGLLEAYLGFTERNHGDVAEARGHFEAAEKIGEQVASNRIIAFAFNGLGSLAADAGDLEAAREAKETSMRALRALGDKWMLSFVVGTLGEICFAKGEYSTAREYLNEALSISRELGNKWSLPYALESIANIDGAENHAGKAVRLYAAASSLREGLAVDLSPSECTSYELALEKLRRLLPDAEFASQWAAGKGMTHIAAIRLALEASKES